MFNNDGHDYKNRDLIGARRSYTILNEVAYHM